MGAQPWSPGIPRLAARAGTALSFRKGSLARTLLRLRATSRTIRRTGGGVFSSPDQVLTGSPADGVTT